MYSNAERGEDKFFERLCKLQRFQRLGINLNFPSLAVGTQSSIGLVFLNVWFLGTRAQRPSSAWSTFFDLSSEARWKNLSSKLQLRCALVNIFFHSEVVFKCEVSGLNKEGGAIVLLKGMKI